MEKLRNPRQNQVSFALLNTPPQRGKKAMKKQTYSFSEMLFYHSKIMREMEHKESEQYRIYLERSKVKHSLISGFQKR